MISLRLYVGCGRSAFAFTVLHSHKGRSVASYGAFRRTHKIRSWLAVVRVLRLSRIDLGHGPKRRLLVVARVTTWLCS